MVNIADAVKRLAQGETDRRQHCQEGCRHAQIQCAADDQNKRRSERKRQYGHMIQYGDRLCRGVSRNGQAHDLAEDPIVSPRPDDEAAFRDVRVRIELEEGVRIGRGIEDAPRVIERVDPVGDVVPVNERSRDG